MQKENKYRHWDEDHGTHKEWSTFASTAATNSRAKWWCWAGGCASGYGDSRMTLMFWMINFPSWGIIGPLLGMVSLRFNDSSNLGLVKQVKSTIEWFSMVKIQGRGKNYKHVIYFSPNPNPNPWVWRGFVNPCQCRNCYISLSLNLRM